MNSSFKFRPTAVKSNIYIRSPEKAKIETKNKLIDESSIIPSNNFDRFGREYFTNRTQRPEGISNFYYDCLHNDRNQSVMRKYPDNCYGKKIPSHDLETVFLQWWFYYGPDISYTFDFVLWNHYEIKFNEFWNIISFLKSLVTFIDNPVDINTLQMDKKVKIHFDEKVHKLINKYTIYKKKMDEIDIQIKRILEFVSQFHADKIILINQLNEVTTALEQYEKERKWMEIKTKEIVQQTSHISHTIKNITKSDVQKFNGKSQQQGGLGALSGTLWQENMARKPMQKAGLTGFPSIPVTSHNMLQDVKSYTFPRNILQVEGNNQLYFKLRPKIEIPGLSNLKEMLSYVATGLQAVKAIASPFVKSKP